MKTVWKITAAVCLTTLFVCAGCAKPEYDALGKRLQALEEKLAAQEELVAEQERLLAEEKTARQALNDSLRAETELLRAKVRNLAGKPVEFTAGAPVEVPEQPIKAAFDHYEDTSLTFQSFLDVYRREYKEQPIYLLAPIESEDDWHPLMHRSYEIYGDGPNRYVSERLMMYSQVLDVENPPVKYQGEGGVKWSLDLRVTLFSNESLAEYSLDGLHLEFGENAEVYWNRYINLYAYHVRIGVCYYQTNAYVSAPWFEEYFYNHLIFS